MLRFLFIFLLIQNFAGAQLCFQPAFHIQADGTPKAITSGDFNEDGLPDLAVANFGTNNISIILGIGGGQFSHDSDFTAGLAPHHIITADLDEDGHLDLATANYYSGDVSVLLGTGQGRFHLPVSYMVGSTPAALVTADFDGDNILDIAVSAPDSVVIIRGTGNGAFTKLTSLLLVSAFGLCTGDFNKDGLADLASTNPPFNMVSVRLATGGGTFGPKVNYYLHNWAYSPTLAVTDLNMDNVIDLVTADQNTASVLLGLGNGIFDTAVAYNAGPQATTVITEDFNLDGKPDIATANFGSDISILLGNGDGTLNPAIHIPAGDGPRGVVSADFNGDGVPDLATANNNSNDASILLSCEILDVSEKFINLQVFPNPVLNQLYVNSSPPCIHVYIYNILGKCVHEQKLQLSKHVNVSGLTNGIYIADIKLADGTRRKHKFMKE